ncbi:MAG: phosphatase PAP2 family protein [Gordonia sp. (in: high G+C Gram-positive bacteria)]|uniref:phosphatase PAP2 family protein n=1 Tax=Gordonia sp. (in: high G+C Gram-positive bacteria) TaxID=84139 RepID=UPI003BB55A4C
MSEYRLPAGALLAGIVVLGAVAVAAHPAPFAIDSAMLYDALSARTPAVTSAAEFLSLLFSPVAMLAWIAAAAISLVAVDRNWFRAIQLVAVCGVAAVVTEAIKWLVDRPRPGSSFRVDEAESAMSYPSGHVSGTAALAFGLVFVVGAAWPKWAQAIAALAALAFTTLCAATRVYLGAHWVTDTIAGGLLGLAAALAVPPLVTSTLDRMSSAPARLRA